jgi:hypothetical protein
VSDDLETAIVVCRTCGMPVRVDFTKDGAIAAVFAVCGHVTMPTAHESAHEDPDGQ